MRIEDVDSVVEVFRRSLRGMRVAIGLPPEYDSTRLDGGVSHMLSTDPGGSWVAESGEGEIAGFAQAGRRGELWVLCHLFVDPTAQSSGIGSELLRLAFAYGERCRSGLIASTPLPAAITLYARLPGFAVHPMVSATGQVKRDVLPPAPDVRDAQDRELADAIDRRVRGGAHGPDLDYLLAGGATLLTVPERGYAVVSPEQVDLLAATDTGVAEQLLAEALRRTRDGAAVSVKRIGAGQPWASRLCVRAGLRLSPWGPLVAWNCEAVTSHYLPDSAFC
ncbi:MAG: GNAT family N-acetyltransferase [Gaiellaceae bacterium]